MQEKVVCLFDVDGTLTKPRNAITDSVLNYILHLSSKIPVAVVSGSDYNKVSSQLGGTDVLNQLPFVFSENGLVLHSHGSLIHSTSIVDHIGESVLQNLINYSLKYMSNLQLPRKRGTFVEFRKGLINLCPVGRSCSQEIRDEFAAYDKVHNIRENFVKALQSEFGSTPLQFAIGGQISIDVFPTGWDKTYCLQFLDKFNTIHFFGDKTEIGGNDYEIFNDPRTIGHCVKSPDDTVNQLKTLFPSI